MMKFAFIMLKIMNHFCALHTWSKQPSPPPGENIDSERIRKKNPENIQCCYDLCVAAVVWARFEEDCGYNK